MANKRIKDLTDTKCTGYAALDDSNGTGKFPIDNLIESIAPVFDATVDYTAGQSAMYEGKLYTFKVDHPAGTWDASHVNADTSASKSFADGVARTVYGVEEANSETTTPVTDSTVTLIDWTYSDVNNDRILTIKVWSDNGALGRFRCNITNKNGVSYGSSYTANIKSYTVSEDTARTLTVRLTNGISRVRITMSASEIVNAGTVHTKVFVSKVEGLTELPSKLDIMEDDVEQIGKQLENGIFEGSDIVPLNVSTPILQVTGLNISSPTVLEIFLWSDGTMNAQARVQAYDSNGTQIGSTVNRNVRTYYYNERSSVHIVIDCPKGLSRFSVNAGKTNVIASGTMYAKAMLLDFDNRIKGCFPYNGGDFLSYINPYDMFRFALLKNYVVWIDDDGRPNGMLKVKQICEALSIKASFAVIGHNFDNLDGDTPYKDIYKQYAALGYDIVCHSYTHDHFWDDNVDEASVCEDVYDSYTIMQENHFPTDVFVYPYGGGRNYQAVRRAVSRYFGIGIMAGHQAPTEAIDNLDPYRFERFFLNSSDADNRTDLVNYITACRAVHKVPIIGSHSNNSSEFDVADVTSKIQAIKDAGFNFITANEFYRIMQPVVIALGMFNRNW